MNFYITESQDRLINENALTTVFITIQLINQPCGVFLEKLTAQTAWVDEYSSYKQAHPR